MAPFVHSPAPVDPSTTTVAGWDLPVVAVAPSTKLFARRSPDRSAVPAVSQTVGRGRMTHHVWISDAGGLLRSAVIPGPGMRKHWALLPFAADPAENVKELAAEYREKFASPFEAASKGGITDGIEPAQTRGIVALALRNALPKRENHSPKQHANLPLQ